MKHASDVAVVFTENQIALKQDKIFLGQRNSICYSYNMHPHGTTPNEFFPHLVEKLNDETLTDAEFREFVRKNTAEVHHQPEMHLSRYGFDGTICGPQTALSWLHARIEKGEC